MILFLDMDGVIVNFVQGVIDYYNLGIEHDDIDAWEAIVEVSGMDTKDFWQGLDNSEFWDNLKFYPHAKKLLEYMEPLEPCLLSSPVWGQATWKQNWIQKNLPDYFYDGRYLLGPGKRCIAGSGRILIDDYDNNIFQWKEAGGIGILFPRPWNALRDYGGCPVEFVNIAVQLCRD